MRPTELADRLLAVLEGDAPAGRLRPAEGKWPDRAWWAGVAVDAGAAGASALRTLAETAQRLGGSPSPALRAHVFDVARIVCANEHRVAAGRPPAAVEVILAALREHVDHQIHKVAAERPH